MPKKLISLALLAGLVLVGCSGPPAAATPEDKKNLDNLIKNGVGTGGAPGAPPSGAPPSGGTTGAPAGGGVAPP